MADLVQRETLPAPALGAAAGRGAIAGVAGGIVFGILMGMMGMLPVVAGLVGSDSAVVGAIVHLVLSAIIGAIYGLAVTNQPRARLYAPALVFGLVYGVIWWVLGPLVIMPLLMGMGLQFGAAFTPPLLLSLVGHLLYGVVTALVFAGLAQRA